MSSTGLALLLLVLTTGIVRLVWLTWSGLHNGRVKPAAFWQPHIDRLGKPRVYWFTIAAHLISIAMGTFLVMLGALHLMA